MMDDSVKIYLDKRETLGGETKYAARIDIPIIRDHGVFRRRRYVGGCWNKWMRPDGDGFPVVSYDPYWTKDRGEADKLLAAAKQESFEVDVRNYPAGAGDP